MMISDTVAADTLWALLWAHAARRVMARLPREDYWELVSAGNGWGLRRTDNRRRGILLHPSGAGRASGDLALTILGVGTQTIPRYNQGYPEYLAVVEDVVATVAQEQLAL